MLAGGPVGGAETYAQDAIAGLAGLGVTQHVICRPHPLPMARFAHAGVPTTAYGFSRLQQAVSGSRAVDRLIEAFQPDLLHGWMCRAMEFIPARVAAPVVGWFGGYYDLKYYRHADAFVGVTDEIIQNVVANGAPAERSFVVHTFGTLPDAEPVSRADFDTPQGAPVVLVLSRMHWKKGIDTILRAIASLPGVYLWLAGDGPDLESYRALSTKLGLDDRVRFLGWRTDRQALLEACDVCALPSRYEPFGTVIPEAWSMRRPLVATRAAGASQYVRDGESGLLCEIDDIDALARALQSALNDPEVRARIIAGGERVYASAFSRDVALGSLLSAYAQIRAMGKRSPKRAA